MLKPSLQLRLSQQLTMTPQLQQAIRLLQLPIMDLHSEIQQALSENVMLETEDVGEPVAEYAPEASSDSAEYEEVSVADDSSWEDTQTVGPGDSVRSGTAGETNFDYEDRSGETLHDHLLWQLELENLDPLTMAIGRAVR